MIKSNSAEKPMTGRTWKKISPEDAERIREHLLKEGATEIPTTNPFEKWRLKIHSSTFIHYTSGTIYRTPGDPEAGRFDTFIESIITRHNKSNASRLLIGLDETGKGEVFGNIILAGVSFPAGISEKLSTIAGSADTKKKHAFRYWDSIMSELEKLTSRGFSYTFEEIVPAWIDKYNLNKLMDILYHRILLEFLKKYKPENLRIVIDDYGVGNRLKNYLNTLQKAGSDIIIEKHSEDRYIETKIASIVSKHLREKHIKALAENKNLAIDGISIKTGNISNAETRQWLERWYTKHKSWPPFVRKSYKNIREIEGLDKKPRKLNPENFDAVIPDTYRKFHIEGKKDIREFSVICPKCHTQLKKVILKVPSGEFHCPIKGCGHNIKNLELCLYFYSGKVVITQDILSDVANLLDKSFFPIGFELLVQREEDLFSCISPTENIYDFLKKFESYRLIKLTNFSSPKIPHICRKENAILMTTNGKFADNLSEEDLFVILVI